VVVRVDVVAVRQRRAYDAAVGLERADPEIDRVGAYQTSTAVESSAGRPSTGRYCEKPVSVAARLHTGSSSTPSIFASASNRGMRTSSCFAMPEYVEPGPVAP